MIRTFVFVALIGAAFAAPAPTAETKAFAAAHSGAAAGVVKPVTSKTAAKGAERKLGGLDAYVATPSKPYKAAVLLVPDIFGWKTDAIRSWANRLADAGYLAVVPDYFMGKDRKRTDTPDTFAAWLNLFPRDKVLEQNAAILADIRKSYPDVKKIGVQGFCWGGQFAVLAVSGKDAPASAAVVYHGSYITKGMVEAVTQPLMFQQSDPALDKQIPDALYKEIEGVLASKKAAGIDTSITNYPKLPHGFSLRGDTGDSAITRAADTAFTAGVAFFDKHLK